MGKKDLGTRAVDTLEACAEVIERLGSAESWHKVANEILRLLGTAVEAHRAYLYRNFRGDDEALYQEYMFEWSVPGVMASIEVPGWETWPYGGGLERWVEVLSSGQAIQGPTDELSEGERKQIDQDIVSICVVPIFVEGEWWGYLGFDDCAEQRHWTTVEIAALRAGAAAIGSAIHRERLDEERRSAELYLRSHLEHLPAVTYIETTSSDNKLGYVEAFISPQIESLLGYTPEEWVGDDNNATWKAIIHPDDKDRVEELARRTSETGEPYMAEYRVSASSDTWSSHPRGAPSLPQAGGSPPTTGRGLDRTRPRCPLQPR